MSRTRRYLSAILCGITSPIWLPMVVLFLTLAAVGGVCLCIFSREYKP